MPKKRTSNDACTIDKSTNEDPDSFEHGYDVKRAKRTSLCDTTLLDLPLELIACILVEAAAMEVKSMKLAKCAWKAKADVAIDRLSTVCSQWDSILKTSFFRNELHRTLDRTAEKTIRLEILQQLPLDFDYVYKMATMRDEIFLLCLSQHEDHGYMHIINVYDRNNMAEVKDVVSLPGLRPRYMAACNVSNSAYILNQETKDKHVSIWRIKRDDENRLAVSPLINNVTWRMEDATLCVTANGWLILTREQTRSLDAITVLDADGFVLHTLRLPSRLASFFRIVPKSNGNLVLVFSMILVPDDINETDLIEIDMSGTVIRKYHASYPDADSMSICFGRTDNHGRLLWTPDQGNRMELLDSEFNVVDFTGPQLSEGQFDCLQEMHYNSERDEIISIWTDYPVRKFLLSIYNLT